MFFIPKLVFLGNAQNIYAIVAERKKIFFRIYPYLYENQ